MNTISEKEADELARKCRQREVSISELLADPRYARTRFGDRVYPSFTIYFRCSESPSGLIRVWGGRREKYPADAPQGTYGPARGDLAAREWGI